MLRKASIVLMLGALVGVVWTFGPVWFGSNFHSVIADRVYRSGEMRAAALERAIDRFRLRSIINLRGREEGRAWYEEERRVARERRLVRYDLDFSSRLLPPRPAVIELVRALREAPEPMLLHCSAGADRAGFASVLARMVKEGSPLSEARAELSLAYGHLPFGPSREIVRMFDLYEADRRRAGSPDTISTFERWLANQYVPYGYRAAIEAQSFPREVSAANPLIVRVRVINTSPEAWVPGRGRGRGIKLGIRVRRKESAAWTDYDRAELGGPVAPGESREVTVSLAAPRVPGEYVFKIDLVDEFVTWFEDQGSEPVLRELAVRK
ncbi:MAG: tyrosine-protein phosphatase [Acidobacteria bacterium]|nr:tyrosine-protein phosphatase [Acidobacteriota bacterium]